MSEEKSFCEKAEGGKKPTKKVFCGSSASDPTESVGIHHVGAFSHDQLCSVCLALQCCLETVMEEHKQVFFNFFFFTLFICNLTTALWDWPAVSSVRNHLVWHN